MVDGEEIDEGPGTNVQGQAEMADAGSAFGEQRPLRCGFAFVAADARIGRKSLASFAGYSVPIGYIMKCPHLLSTLATRAQFRGFLFSCDANILVSVPFSASLDKGPVGT